MTDHTFTPAQSGAMREALEWYAKRQWDGGARARTALAAQPPAAPVEKMPTARPVAFRVPRVVDGKVSKTEFRLFNDEDDARRAACDIAADYDGLYLVADRRAAFFAQPDPRSSADSESVLLEIIGHLGAILVQAIPSDDQIIIDHVRQAHELAIALRRGSSGPDKAGGGQAAGGGGESAEKVSELAAPFSAGKESAPLLKEAAAALEYLADRPRPTGGQDKFNAEHLYDIALNLRLLGKPQTAPDKLTYGIVDPDYARVFTMARVLAWAEGYALLFHGSFTRDLDLVAIPWTGAACEPEHLLKRIIAAADLKIVVENDDTKHWGRMVWTLAFKTFGDPRFIDFSIMPRDADTSSLSRPQEK